MREDDDALLYLSVAREPDWEQVALSEVDDDDRDLMAFMDIDLIEFARPCSLDRNPNKSNWVEDGGGLPNYICRIARSVHRKRGRSISQAIAIAVGTVKRWARGGDEVNADTRAKAAKAVAEWTALKAKAKARRAAKKG